MATDTAQPAQLSPNVNSGLVLIKFKSPHSGRRRREIRSSPKAHLNITMMMIIGRGRVFAAYSPICVVGRSELGKAVIDELVSLIKFFPLLLSMGIHTANLNKRCLY